MEALQDYLRIHNFHLEQGNRITTNLKINPEKYHQILLKLSDSAKSDIQYQVSKIIRDTEWISIASTQERASNIFREIATLDSEQRLDSLTDHKQKIVTPERIVDIIPEINLELVQPAQLVRVPLENPDELRSEQTIETGKISGNLWVGTMKLEEVADFQSTTTDNIFTLKRTLNANSPTSSLYNSYRYQFYLTIIDPDNYLLDLWTFLDLLFDNGDGWSLEDLTSRFLVYSQIYNLYSKNEYMASLINERIGYIDENYKRTLNHTNNPKYVERMPIFRHVHLATKIPVVDLKHDDLRTVLCRNSDFCLTDKADGYRSQLYINEKGRAILTGFGNAEHLSIHSQLDQYGPKYHDCLFDGEMITTQSGQRIYLIFDCLFWNGESLLEYPLLHRNNNVLTFSDHCRYNTDKLIRICKDLNNMRTTDTDVTFSFKRYYWAPSCQEQRDMCREIYTKEYPYNLDGLIFTNYTMTVPEMLANRHYAAFRWKPIKHLSIDVLVRLERDPNFPLLPIVSTDKNGNYITATLQSRNPTRSKQFDHFSRVYLPIDTNLLASTAEGDPIYDETIIEFIADSDKGSELHWTPLRGREEKTKIGLADRSDKVRIIETVAKTGASESQLFQYTCGIATSAIDNTSDCLTFEHRPVEITTKYFLDNPYKSFVREHYLKDIIDFNGIVKFNIIYPYLFTPTKPGQRQYLPNYLDLACGRANDFYIWKNNVNFYLGIDIDPDNISTAKNVAKKTNLGPKYQFMIGDLSDPFLSKHIDTKTQDYFNNGRFPTGSPKKYNIISIQFAIHYMANNIRNLNQLLQLCSSSIYRGGYLIFTSFDGAAIHQYLRDSPSESSISDTGDILWKLERRYPNGQPLLDAGQEIHFTMQSLMGFRPSQEFLVNYDYITKQLTGHRDGLGFKLVESRRFSDIIDDEQLYWQYIDQIQINGQTRRFKDVDYESLRSNILNQPHLYSLAQFYRYAVFQKI